ncbi:LysR family transcriptional regulator [uncultured Clostridium sp.]|uniref:LysR family transcriptional regulator n=1 Tax=uncultured Clostridium sp. TaxID=59620 RepID=UPI0025FC163A|nr:LysR family transcriptional regulator [uncultured Clostridium sp.]
MDINSLQCFLSLAQYLNFTKTAEKEHLTQSSLSRKISVLENELGIRLFERDSHQVTLTEAGKEFYYDTSKYMESYYAAVTRAQNIQNGFKRSLNIGIGLYEQDLLSGFLPGFMKRHPEIALGCYQYSYLELMERFEEGLVDVILTEDKYFNKFNLSKADVRLINDAPWMLAVSERDPISDIPVLGREELEGKTIVTMSEEPAQELLEGYRLLGNFKNIIYVNSFASKMLMVNSGLGISIIPSFVNTGAFAGIRKKMVKESYCPKTFYLVLRRQPEKNDAYVFAEEYMAAAVSISDKK